MRAISQARTRIRKRCTRMLRSMLLAASGLASRNRRCENVRVLPVIVAELELGDIERHVLAAVRLVPIAP